MRLSNKSTGDRVELECKPGNRDQVAGLPTWCSSSLATPTPDDAPGRGDGEPFAVLIEPDNGPPYLVPPIVLDRNGSPIEGRQVLAAILELLIIRNATARDLAMVDRRMAAISEQLGEPVGPPDDEDLASG